MSPAFLYFLETVLNGLMTGVMYSLVALGFVLIFKASGIFNFAQGVMALFAALTLVGLQTGQVPFSHLINAVFGTGFLQPLQQVVCETAAHEQIEVRVMQREQCAGFRQPGVSADTARKLARMQIESAALGEQLANFFTRKPQSDE